MGSIQSNLKKYTKKNKFWCMIRDIEKNEPEKHIMRSVVSCIDGGS